MTDGIRIHCRACDTPMESVEEAPSRIVGAGGPLPMHMAASYRVACPKCEGNRQITPLTPNDYSPTYWIEHEGDTYIGLKRVSGLPPEFDDGKSEEITPAHREYAEELWRKSSFREALAKHSGEQQGGEQ